MDTVPNWKDDFEYSDVGTLDSSGQIPFGNYVLKVGKTNTYSSEYEVYQEVSLAPGVYNLSAFAKISKNIFSGNLNFVGYLDILPLQGSFGKNYRQEFNNSNYELITTSFIINEPMKVKIICGIKTINGDSELSNNDFAYFDNIQISDGDMKNLNNIIPNHSFETNSNWNLGNSRIIEREGILTENDITKLFGLSRLCISAQEVVTQDFYYTAKSNDHFSFGAFALISDKYSNLKVKIRFYDSFSEITTDYYVLNFTSGSNCESYITSNITVDENKEIENVYNKIEIKIENEGTNNIYVDNVHLFNFHNGTTYEYDSEGKLIDIEQEYSEITFEYTNGEISKIITKNYDYTITKNYETDDPDNLHGEILQTDTIVTEFDKITNTITNTLNERLFTFYALDKDHYNAATEETDYYALVKTVYDQNNQGKTTGAIIDIKTNAVVSILNEYGYQTRYEYDELDRIEKIINSLYEYEKYSFLYGNLISEKEIGKIVDGEDNCVNSIEYSYDFVGNIKEVCINGNLDKTYKIEYDAFNNITLVKLGEKILIQYEYYVINGINTGLISKEIKPNGEYIRYEYGKDFTISACYKGILNETLEIEEKLCYTCLYDSNGALAYYKDNYENKSYYYNYDISGNLIEIKILNDAIDNNLDNNYDYIRFEYNDNNLSKTIYYFNGETLVNEYEFDTDNELNNSKINDIIFTSPTEFVDGAMKYFKRSIQNVDNIENQNIVEEILYFDTSGMNMLKQKETLDLRVDLLDNDTSLFTVNSRISKQEFIIKTVNSTTLETQQLSYSYEYFYDKVGNVNKIIFDNYENQLEDRTFYYDYSFNQLIEEEVYEGIIRDDKEINNYLNILLTKYSYDNFGNVSKIVRTVNLLEYSDLPKIQNFYYNKLNQITSYYIDGIKYDFSYDLNGNLVTYKNYSLKFQDGKIVKLEDENNVITYEYNSLGVRTKKIVNGKTYEYITFNNIIISETVNDGGDTCTIRYLYDNDNNAVGFELNSHNYFYIKNLLGEIVFIVSEDGNIVGEYKYDAYGNIININDLTIIAQINSIRYKGYYYDVETNLFLVSSRYYSPELCRWISPDDIEYLDPESVNGLNLYCYCFNNPIMYIDPDGHSPKWLDCLLIAGMAAAAIALTIVSCGSASAAIAPLAFAYFGIAANTTLAITTAAAVVTSVGIAAFAVADIQSVITDGGSNYLSFLGGAYDGVKSTFYFASYMFGYAGQFAQPGWGRETRGKTDAPQYSHQYGKYIKETPRGNDVTIYNGRGQAIIRYDSSHIHNGMQPHTHYIKWWIYNKKWRWDGPRGTVVSN